MNDEGQRQDIFEVFGPVGSAPAQRACTAPGCTLEGSYRAPVSRDRINEYRWFCLDHVRLYNAAWNYYSGLNDVEMEAAIRSDSTWNRPTWPLGKGQGAREAGAGSASFGPGQGANAQSTPFDNLDDPFGLLRGNGFGPRPGMKGDTAPPPQLNAAERKAFATLELTYPITFEDLRAQYKVLVKRYHPDANGGAKEAEERLKRVNAAYKTLKTKLFA